MTAGIVYGVALIFAAFGLAVGTDIVIRSLQLSILFKAIISIPSLIFSLSALILATRYLTGAIAGHYLRDNPLAVVARVLRTLVNSETE